MVATSRVERNLPKISVSEQSAISDSDCDKNVATCKDNAKSSSSFKTELVWRNVITFVIFHALVIYGLVAYRHVLGIKALLVVFFGGQLSGLGVTVGAHRLWAHRCFKARMPLRIVLMLLQTTAGQNSIYIWCRDHRMHHKYTETDADPHTTTRGMFFAHMGWLMMKKHPEVVRLGKVLDCSDLMADPVVRFQYRWFVPLVILGVGVVPFYVYRLMGFSPELASFLTLARYLILLHGTWCVNSIAHWIGSKPYDKTIRPTESIFTSWLTNGEGFHNFHHVFPFDYKAAELPFSPLNFSTVLINVMAAIGQVYNLKEASEEMIVKRKARTGDGHIY